MAVAPLIATEPPKVVELLPDDGGGAADRDGDAEPVRQVAVVGKELGDLPAGAGVEEVGGAGANAVVIVPPGPDDSGGAADRDGDAELIEHRAVIGQ